MRNATRFSKRLLISIGVLILIYFLGSLGEDLEFLDALFMTTITITTVGYGLVTDLSVAGTIYTIILIIGGTGVAAYILINIGDYVPYAAWGAWAWRLLMSSAIIRLAS